jgi:hypothetical protein
MTRTSIDDPFRDEGDREPEELTVWLAEGFTEEDAELWRRWRFTLTEAHQWIASGIDEGLTAAQWQTAGVRADRVRAWTDAGVTSTEAVAWHEFGCDLPMAADGKAKGLSPKDFFEQQQQHQQTVVRRGGAIIASSPHHPMQNWMQAGVRPEVMHSYMMRQRTDDDALRWARHGIEAAESEVWDALGLTPEEAGRLTRQGRKAAEVIRDWWGAGIPIDEVAEWIGAGMTATEAAEQRARGITAEHAAALRALRLGDEATN